MFKCVRMVSDPIGNKYVRSNFLSRSELTFKYIATYLYYSISVIHVKFPFKSFDMYIIYIWVINSLQPSTVDHVHYINPHLF